MRNVFWHDIELMMKTRESQRRRWYNWLYLWLCTFVSHVRVWVYEGECVWTHSVPSVREYMSMNWPQQGGWSSVGDEYADMTVMHGDVYSKWKDMGKSRETEGRWKEPMFIPSSVQQRELAQVYMNKWGQFIYHFLLTVWFLLSALYDITKGMQLLSKLTMLSLHGWLVFRTCSDSRHIEPDAPTLANYNHRWRCLWGECSKSLHAATHTHRQQTQ